MMNEYQYQDPNDTLCTDSITSENFNQSYWEESEALVLEHCFSLAFPPQGCAVKSADVGCGEGRLLGPLSERSSLVVGVEPSRERFENAVKSSKCFSNAIVLNGTAELLPSESFDVVFCSHVFQHISFDEQDKLAANILRALKPGGIAVITTTFNEGEQSEFITQYWKGRQRIQESIDEAEFDGIHGKAGMFPIQRFSRTDFLKRFDSCKTLDFGCYHFAGVDDASQDAELNQRGELSGAKDAYYVLQKPKARLPLPEKARALLRRRPRLSFRKRQN